MWFVFFVLTLAQIGIVAGLLAVFGPFLARKMFSGKPVKRLPPREVKQVEKIERELMVWFRLWQFTITRRKMMKS